MFKTNQLKCPEKVNSNNDNNIFLLLLKQFYMYSQG